MRYWMIGFSILAPLLTAAAIGLYIANMQGLEITRYIPGEGRIVSVSLLVEILLDLALASLFLACLLGAMINNARKRR